MASPELEFPPLSYSASHSSSLSSLPLAAFLI